MLKKPTTLAVLLICAVGAAAGIRWFIHARSWSAPNHCTNNIRQLQSLKDAWAIEHHKTTNDIPTWEDIRPYLPQSERERGPTCPRGGTYALGRVGDLPTCSIGGPDHTLK